MMNTVVDNWTLTSLDIENAIKDLAKNKTPGPDGIPAEVYMFDPAGWALKILEAWNEDTHSFSEAEIKLLPKGNSDRSLVSNLRPIALLNVDRKIIAKALATKIKGLVNLIVPPGQFGFVHTRKISTPLIFLRLYEQATLEQENAGLLAIDFSKAFDSVCRDFIVATMVKLGFPEDFLNHVRKLLKPVNCRISSPPFFSKTYQTFGGIPQGDPLSPILFALATIPLILNLTARGIKAYLYADDATALLNSTHDYDIAAEIFAEYELVSGLKINQKKTELWILKGSIPLPLGCQIVTLPAHQPIRILGNFFNRPTPLFTPLFNIISKINAKCHIVFKMVSSVVARSKLMSTFFFSKLLYSLISLPFDTKIAEQIEKQIRRLVIGSQTGNINKTKPFTLPCSLLYQSLKEGGFGLPNFRAYWLAANASIAISALNPGTVNFPEMLYSSLFKQNLREQIIDSRQRLFHPNPLNYSAFFGIHPNSHLLASSAMYALSLCNFDIGGRPASPKDRVDLYSWPLIWTPIVNLPKNLSVQGILLDSSVGSFLEKTQQELNMKLPTFLRMTQNLTQEYWNAYDNIDSTQPGYEIGIAESYSSLSISEHGIISDRNLTNNTVTINNKQIEFSRLRSIVVIDGLLRP